MQTSVVEGDSALTGIELGLLGYEWEDNAHYPWLGIHIKSKEANSLAASSANAVQRTYLSWWWLVDNCTTTRGHKCGAVQAPSPGPPCCCQWSQPGLRPPAPPEQAAPPHSPVVRHICSTTWWFLNSSRDTRGGELWHGSVARSPVMQ